MDTQRLLFRPSELRELRNASSSTFADNTKLPVHRWMRYSAGFSGAWAEHVISEAAAKSDTRVFDPFAGSGTTLIAAENVGVESWGIEPHPFVAKITHAKLAHRSSPREYASLTHEVRVSAQRRKAKIDEYPDLIQRCYSDEALADLDTLRRAYEDIADDSPASRLVWLTLVSMLRSCSNVNTASWQYVLPRKPKKNPAAPYAAFDKLSRLIHEDMVHSSDLTGPAACFRQEDARECKSVPDDFATIIVTSPPYPNNFDYADATRLEMTFMREIDSWGDLQESVRTYLIRSCSQHVPQRKHDLNAILEQDVLDPIKAGITDVCSELADVRLTKGGKKTYHLMVACYFYDLAVTWHQLRRVCSTPSLTCFVVGDSAPYGVYVPVHEWLGQLALAAGFKSFEFEETRKRNIKWKNRKHRVPLCEGRLWIRG